MILENDGSREGKLHYELRQWHPSAFRIQGGLKHEFIGGFFSDKYFPRAAQIVYKSGIKADVTMQFFAKKEGIVAGLWEAIAMVRADERFLNSLTVDTLLEGDPLVPWEPVMHLSGPYDVIAHLETMMLGVMARRSLVATNASRVVKAANGKPVMFMGARHDDWRVQECDGYAALLGGCTSVSTDANGMWLGEEGVGTMPHALIACFGGDVVKAALAFADKIPDIPLIALVDYNNNCRADSIAVANAMAKEYPGRLVGVRLDTSEKLKDYCMGKRPDSPELYGVNPELVWEVRMALNDHGHKDVGIWVSGGFTPAKIRRFESAGAAVTGYGVGSSIIGHNDGQAQGLYTGLDFTADVVRLNGRRENKVGREFIENPKLVRLDWSKV